MFPPSSIILGLAAMAGLVDATKTAGCGKQGLQSGVYNVQVNGRNRQYTLKVPNGYNNQRAHNLVFGFHWLGGSMQNVADGGYYGLDPLSQGSTIFVAPNGLNAGWANNGGEDITFTDAILANVNNNLCVDDKKIFATGFSYGGAMSFSVACARPNVFRAVAPIAGAELSGCNGGNTPVAYLGIHGVADSVLPVDRGRALRDRFLNVNGCASKNAPEPNRGSGTHIKTEYSCSKRPVWWIAHGGDHVGDPRDSNGSLWAPGETWNFFNNVA